MSTPFRARDYRPVPAADRPRRFREAARVVITDRDTILMIADTDPGLPGSRWWVTPGGGIDPGETALEAAVREVAEETGLVVAPDSLLGPLAHRTVVHGYSDQVLSQAETFYLLLVEEPFKVEPAGLTANEAITLHAWEWLPLASLADLPDPVWPRGVVELVELIDRPHLWPVDLGAVEESTLGVE